MIGVSPHVGVQNGYGKTIMFLSLKLESQVISNVTLWETGPVDTRCFPAVFANRETLNMVSREYGDA